MTLDNLIKMAAINAVTGNAARALPAPSDETIRYLDNTLKSENGQVQMVRASALEGIPQTDICCWCVMNAVYVIPTTELVDCIRKEIGSMRAIEIGSGCSCLGRWLCIPCTDSKMQERPDVKAHYEMFNQPAITYPPDVQKFDALEACDHYRPQVVVGAFITHKHQSGMKEGNMYGVRERDMLCHLEKYIHVGNLKTHHAKPLLKMPHREIKAEWIFTRSFEKEFNRVMIWEPK